MQTNATANRGLRKTDLEGCGTTLNVCVQTTKALATLMAPFLPFSAAKCRLMHKSDEYAAKYNVFPNAWAWLLSKIKQLPTFPVRGRLGI